MMAKGALALDASTKERIFNIQSSILLDGWMDGYRIVWIDGCCDDTLVVSLVTHLV